MQDQNISSVATANSAPLFSWQASQHRQLNAPGAAFLGVLAIGLVNTHFVVKGARAASASVATTVAYDLVHFAVAGLLLAAAVHAWLILRPARRLVDVAAAFIVAAAVGFPLLAYDLTTFSERNAETVPAIVTRTLLTLSIAALVPGALVVGGLSRRWLVSRAAALLAAVFVVWANGVLLKRDYEGIHFYLAWGAATLAASALVGLPVGRWRWPALRGLPASPLQRSTPLFVAALAGLAGVISWQPSGRVASALSRASGSVLVPMTTLARGRLGLGAATAAIEDDEWLRSRSNLPPIPASQPGLLPKNPLVVLLTVDALRADIVNSPKYEAQLPNLTKLRKSCVSFSEARATSSVTRLSLSSLFMGTHFLQQYWTKGEGHFTFMPEHEEAPRFTNLLQKAGVHTSNVTSMRWMRAKLGVARGFDYEDYVPTRKKQPYAPSDTMFAQVLPYLKGLEAKPAFHFSHLADTHSPYDLGGKQGSELERYVGEAKFLDGNIAKLLEFLEDPAVEERVVLILSADHGEELLEHGATDHGTTLFDEVLRVPLWFRIPGVAPREVDVPVSLIDVAPTVLDLYGLDTPGYFMGQSLVPFLRGETPKLTRPVLSETRSMISYVSPESVKVVFDTKTQRAELYDLRADPKELTNSSDETALLAQPLAYVKKFHEVHRLRKDGYQRPEVR